MVTKERIEELMSESIGSEHWYRREPFTGFVYTDGVMTIQNELNMFWFVDMVVSYIPTVIKDFKKSEETFYTVVLKVEADHRAYFEISREIYDENGDYQDFIVAKQDIEYTDLPECEMKFFLELAEYNPTTFCLLCPSEH